MTKWVSIITCSHNFTHLTNCARAHEMHHRLHRVEVHGLACWLVAHLMACTCADTLLAWLRCCNCDRASFDWRMSRLMLMMLRKCGFTMMVPVSDHDKSRGAGSGSCCSLQSCAVRLAMMDKTHMVLLHVISMHIHGNTHVE